MHTRTTYLPEEDVFLPGNNIRRDLSIERRMSSPDQVPDEGSAERLSMCGCCIVWVRSSMVRIIIKGGRFSHAFLPLHNILINGHRRVEGT